MFDLTSARKQKANDQSLSIDLSWKNPNHDEIQAFINEIATTTALKINSFSLHGNNLADDAAALVVALISAHPEIQTLILRNTGLTKQSLSDITTALFTRPNAIIALDLGFNNLDDDDLVQLEREFRAKQPNRKIILDIGGNIEISPKTIVLITQRTPQLTMVFELPKIPFVSMTECNRLIAEAEEKGKAHLAAANLKLQSAQNELARSPKSLEAAKKLLQKENESILANSRTDMAAANLKIQHAQDELDQLRLEFEKTKQLLQKEHEGIIVNAEKNLAAEKLKLQYAETQLRQLQQELSQTRQSLQPRNEPIVANIDTDLAAEKLKLQNAQTELARLRQELENAKKLLQQEKNASSLILQNHDKNMINCSKTIEAHEKTIADQKAKINALALLEQEQHELQTIISAQRATAASTATAVSVVPARVLPTTPIGSIPKPFQASASPQSTSTTSSSASTTSVKPTTVANASTLPPPPTASPKLTLPRQNTPTTPAGVSSPGNQTPSTLMQSPSPISTATSIVLPPPPVFTPQKPIPVATPASTPSTPVANAVTMTLSTSTTSPAVASASTLPPLMTSKAVTQPESPQATPPAMTYQQAMTAAKAAVDEGFYMRAFEYYITAAKLVTANPPGMLSGYSFIWGAPTKESVKTEITHVFKLIFNENRKNQFYKEIFNCMLIAKKNDISLEQLIGNIQELEGNELITLFKQAMTFLNDGIRPPIDTQNLLDFITLIIKAIIKSNVNDTQCREQFNHLIIEKINNINLAQLPSYLKLLEENDLIYLYQQAVRFPNPEDIKKITSLIVMDLKEIISSEINIQHYKMIFNSFIKNINNIPIIQQIDDKCLTALFEKAVDLLSEKLIELDDFKKFTDLILLSLAKQNVKDAHLLKDEEVLERFKVMDVCQSFLKMQFDRIMKLVEERTKLTERHAELTRNLPPPTPHTITPHPPTTNIGAPEPSIPPEQDEPESSSSSSTTSISEAKKKLKPPAERVLRSPATQSAKPNMYDALKSALTRMRPDVEPVSDDDDDNTDDNEHTDDDDWDAPKPGGFKKQL